MQLNSYILNKLGKAVNETTVANTSDDLETFFSKYKGATVAIEAGTHSPWISRFLVNLGCTKCIAAQGVEKCAGRVRIAHRRHVVH